MKPGTRSFKARIACAFDRTRSEDFSANVRSALRIDLSVALLFTAFSAFTVPFIGLILRRDLGATPFQLSLMASASAACMLLSLGWARMIERDPLPWVVWPGFVARALFLLVPFIRTPWPFIGVVVTGSCLGTIQAPAQAALVERLYPREQRGRALGTVRVTAAFVAIGLSLVTGHLLDFVDYRWVFFFAALLGMASSLRQRDLPVPAPTVEPVDEPPRLADAWRAVRDDRDFRRLLLAMFLFGSGIWIQTPAMPLMLADVVQATTGQVGMFAAVAAVAGLVGNAYWGRYVDLHSSLRALRLVYLLGVLNAAILYIARTPWMMIPAATVESVMATGIDLVWMMAVIDAAGPKRVPQYMAISATLAGVRGVVGPLVGGAVIEAFGVQAVYPVAGVLMAYAAWLVTRQLREGRRVAVGDASNTAITSAT